MLRLSRRRRYSGESLIKYIYLKDSELKYRSLSADGLSEDSFGTYYEQVILLSDQRRSALRLYALTFSGAVLAACGGIAEAQAGGVTIASGLINHAILLLWAWSQCALGIVDAKFSYITGLFEERLKALSTHSRKINFLCRYPLALPLHDYYVERLGPPGLLIRMAAPLRMIVFVLSIMVSLGTYVAFALWVYIALSNKVLASSSPSPEWLSVIVVALSGLIMILSYTLPTTGWLRKRYMHMGLVRLLERTMNNNPERYSQYVQKISATERRMGLRND